MLAEGDATDYLAVDGKPDRSRARMALAVACVNAGWDYAWFHHELTDPGNLASRWYRLDHRGKKRKVDGLIRRDWRNAQAFVSRAPAILSKNDARQRIGELRALASTSVWDGRTGSMDRRVLHAVHSISTTLGRMDLDLSVRTLADTAGVGRSTAGRSLRRLAERGWLRRSGRADPERGLAASYVLTWPTDSGLSTSSGVPCVSSAASDFWSVAGPVEEHVRDALTTGPKTVGELQELTGRARSTVGLHLARLRHDGLAAEVGELWWALDADMTRLANDLGLTGRLEARRARHEREREAQAVRRNLKASRRGQTRQRQR